MRLHNKHYLIERRRELRQRLTIAEYVFWQHVRNRKLAGLKFKRQHSIGNYIVDFYCASQKLIIELDGEIHDTEEQYKKDVIRDENLASMNFKVLRFRNEEIMTEMNSVKQKIIKVALQETPPSP